MLGIDFAPSSQREAERVILRQSTGVHLNRNVLSLKPGPAKIDGRHRSDASEQVDTTASTGLTVIDDSLGDCLEKGCSVSSGSFSERVVLEERVTLEDTDDVENALTPRFSPHLPIFGWSSDRLLRPLEIKAYRLLLRPRPPSTQDIHMLFEMIPRSYLSSSRWCG